MLAGRPHEAVGNGSPRWMAVGPRSRGCTEPGLQAGSPLTPTLACAGAFNYAALAFNRRGRGMVFAGSQVSGVAVQARGGSVILAPWLTGFPGSAVLGAW